ncbi:MAG: BON domain-containing protein [Planctomycetaceae bacterium]|nr:BON domain-containing protein [Planctomycetaceae bacterium]
MNWDWIEDGWERLKEMATESWGRLTGQLGRVAAVTKGRAVSAFRAATGELRERAEGVPDDVGRVDVDVESRSPTSSGMAGGVALVGLGAGLMYFLDPDRGRRRRALVRDQVVHALSEIDDAIGVISRDLGNRSRGAWAGVRSLRGRLAGEAVPDEVLAERVRSEMGRFVSHPGSIEVEARGGRVTLSGPILAHEVDGLLAAVARVPGVQRVEERLERHEQPGGVSGLQGGRSRVGERPELCQANWSPTARLLVGSAGTALLAAGAGRRGAAGLALGALGAGLLVRAVTNIPLRHWLEPESRPEPRETTMTPRAARESGEPGGGRGRTDVVGRTGVYPASGPYPAGEAAVRTPGSFVHGQRDAEGREEAGGSEPIDFNRETLLGGETPPPSGEPRDAGPQRDKAL